MKYLVEDGWMSGWVDESMSSGDTERAGIFPRDERWVDGSTPLGTSG